MDYLLKLAILPIIILGDYIYKKDVHREPPKLLFKIFVLGVLSCIPIIFFEEIFSFKFNTDDGNLTFIAIFINVFFGIAIVEEGFKWLVTKLFGYNNREFDEVYDVIVYAVFASLGFSCIENILYVLNYGFSTGILRAFTAVPGHACFGILMGYYMGKAKVNELNNQVGLKNKNMLFSLLIPTIFHTIYDALLTSSYEYCFILFFIFDIFMVIYCFKTIKKMSNIQQNLDLNIENGNIKEDSNGIIQYDTEKMINDANKSQSLVCPICNHGISDSLKYCPNCGFYVKGDK